MSKSGSGTTHAITELDDKTRIIETQYADQRKKYLYLAEAPPIENVVFSGGGAKGVVYPGVIQALEGEPIKYVAGSSIGAITAALYASGMSGATFEAITEELDFESLLGSFDKKKLAKTGDPLLDFLKENIANSILTKLRAADVDLLVAQYDKLEASQKNVIYKMLGGSQDKAIRDLFLAARDKNFKITEPITFSMLTALRQFNEVPGIDGAFKDLSVTSVCKEDGKRYIFSDDASPNLEIALACRASASLPVILAPVEIDPALLGIHSETGQPLHFVDGGFLDNIPVSAVDSKQTKEWGVNLGEQGQNLQTLVFIFDETTNKAREENVQSPYLETAEFKDRDLYVPGIIDRIKRDIVPKVPIIGGVRTKVKNTTAKAQGLKEINANFTQRNVPLIVAGIGSSDFRLAKEKAKELISASNKATKEYIANRKFANDIEAIGYTFDNPVSLFLYLPIQKLQQLIAGNKDIYGLTMSDLTNIETFRREISQIFNDRNKNDTAVNVLNDFSNYLSNSPTLPGKSKQPYSEYIIDLLHEDAVLWQDIIRNKNVPPKMNSDLVNAIHKREAEDQLLLKKRELVKWIDEERNHTKNDKNIELLDIARMNVINATSFTSLAAAIDPVRNNYHDEAKILTMLGLFRKSPTVLKAEKYTVSIGRDILVHDPYLAIEPTTHGQTNQEKATTEDITDRLRKIKQGLDSYVDQYGKGVNGLYTKALGMVDSDALRVKKLEFAKRHSQHISTVLTHVDSVNENGTQLRNATKSLLTLFSQERKDIYKKNEDDEYNTRCDFKKCIDRVNKHLAELQDTLGVKSSASIR